MTKDNNVPMSNEGCRRDSLNNSQRSSASPTSNIWLRLIEDEENIGNVNSEFAFLSRCYNFPFHRVNPEYSHKPIFSSSFTESNHHHTSNTLIWTSKITLHRQKTILWSYPLSNILPQPFIIFNPLNILASTITSY